MIESAIQDAKSNAILNNLENCEFIAGKCEDVLPKLLPTIQDYSNLVTILDPPRAGLRNLFLVLDVF